MQKGLGIVALVIAIISIFIPVAGPWLTILTGAVAAFVYGEGFALGLSSIINMINIFVRSSALWFAMGARAIAGEQDGEWLP